MDANLTADAILTKPGVGLRSLIPLAQAARPRQWIKNFACFAGLVFSGRMFEPAAIVESILAFAGFCLAASAVYLLNDVVDRRMDRLNPSKRDRPIASGLVPVSWALGASGVLAVGALGTTIWLAPICLMVLALYLVMNVAYSLRLKHTVLLDVLIIAFGFVLRVLYGVYAIEVKPTSWIVLCMFFLALFLGFAKRRGEMHLMGDDEPFRRPVLSKYRISFLDLMLGNDGHPGDPLLCPLHRHRAPGKCLARGDSSAGHVRGFPLHAAGHGRGRGRGSREAAGHGPHPARHGSPLGRLLRAGPLLEDPAFQPSEPRPGLALHLSYRASATAAGWRRIHVDLIRGRSLPQDRGDVPSRAAGRGIVSNQRPAPRRRRTASVSCSVEGLRISRLTRSRSAAERAGCCPFMPGTSPA